MPRKTYRVALASRSMPIPRSLIGRILIRGKLSPRIAPKPAADILVPRSTRAEIHSGISQALLATRESVQRANANINATHHSACPATGTVSAAIPMLAKILANNLNEKSFTLPYVGRGGQKRERRPKVPKVPVGVLKVPLLGSTLLLT